MSEKHLVPAGDTTAIALENLERYDDEAFKRLQLLKKHKFNREAMFQLEQALLEEAFDSSLLATREEQVESEKIVASYDPIMWDLLRDRVESYHDYLDLLKKAIVILEVKREEIEREYNSILLPYRWKLRLRAEHRKYGRFVGENYPKTVVILALCTGVVLLCSTPVLAAIALW